jgi:hypothetical protein
MKLVAKIVNVAKVTPPERDEMFALMDEHYANVHRSVFDADLAEKRWVILVRDPAQDRLRGFSTQTLVDVQVAGRAVKALFSGDTIIHRDCWGDSALFHVWGRLALALIDDDPDQELYWLLISQGYKTYRLLPLFFYEFYPRHDTPTPDPLKDILDTFASARYSKDYDPFTGVIRATPQQYCLRPGVAKATVERLRDPHVSFFYASNPGHSRGDELCCLAPLTRANFKPAAYRVIGPEPQWVSGE